MVRAYQSVYSLPENGNQVGLKTKESTFYEKI